MHRLFRKERKMTCHQNPGPDNKQCVLAARKRSVTINLSWTGIASRNFVFCLAMHCLIKSRTCSNCTAVIWIKFLNCCASSNLNSFTSVEQAPNSFCRSTHFLTQHSLFFTFRFLAILYATIKARAWRESIRKTDVRSYQLAGLVRIYKEKRCT